VTRAVTVLRGAIVATARALAARGLTHGKSGNVSARWRDGFLVTPSGHPYEEMTAADVVAMTFDGRATGRREPSSEWRFHAAIYAARPEAGAVVHCHSPAATALSCHRRGIPAFHYMVAVAGGADVRCAPYATFGTAELAASAVAALVGRRACLLANHGQITLGADLGAALRLAGEIENLCDQYLRALSIGEPVVLSDDAMAEVLAKFETYGVGKLGAASKRRRPPG
jgi:L-fuculose-phosphate aldolase